MKNARVLSFRGPEHHMQLMRPVEDALVQRGAEVLRFTTDAEACFQVGLQREFSPHGYLWLPDYGDEKAALRLYQEHAPWLRELLLTPNALSLMLPQVLDRVMLFICREWVALRRLLREVRPTHALALHEINRWGAMLGALCQERGIPYFTLQEGLYYGEPFIYTGHATYSRSLIWGEATRRKLLQAGCSPERIELLGHPDLATRWRLGAEGRQKLDEELPSQARGKRLIFVFLAHVKVDPNSGEAAFQGLDGSEYFLVGRMHQLAALPDIAAMEQAFARHPDNSWLSPNTMPYAHHWRVMAAAEAALLIGCSTTALEWSTSGKPWGQIATQQMARNFAAEGLAVACDGLPFKAALDKVFAEWGAGGYEERRQRFVAEELCHLDAAEQIAERILRG
jgi:hypothetical protein